MKPALLYLRKYIDDNYNHYRPNRYHDKENKSNQSNKICQQTFFKEKKSYDCSNTKVREFYFRPGKTVNGAKFKHKFLSETMKTDFQSNGVKMQHSSKQSQRTSVGTDSKKVRRTIVSNTGQNSPRYNDMIQSTSQNEQNQSIQQQKEVRFVISPPVSSTPQFGSSMEFQTTAKNLKEKTAQKIDVIEEQQAPPDELDQVKNSESSDSPQNMEMPKSQHFKMSSKSMKKIGYNTLFEYLNEMKKYNRIKKKEIKEACYYPLACMTPEINEIHELEKTSKEERAFFLQKVDRFSKEIAVREGFSSKTIEMRNFNNNSRVLKRGPKSNFSKGQSKNADAPLTDQMIEKKAKKFLLEYEQVVMCNCANKKYFSYRLSLNTDYNSFFTFTTPLLDSIPEKDNNYLIGNKEAESLGLYFCCLINSSLGVREGFFWIGKPIQYYRKDKIIKVIDDFICDSKIFDLFESDRLWIVDNHGRNSHIMKTLLKRCCDQRNSHESNASVAKKGRVSKRISLSMSHQPNTQTPEAFASLLANFSEFNQTIFVKKQRNNISTRGPFKLLYQPSQSHYDKKKTNYQSKF